MLSRRRAVFLDRDGVLCRATVRGGLPRAPAALAEVELACGARAACGVLRAAGFVLVMATNQPDVARGLIARAAVDAINDHLRTRLGLDAIEVCCHDDRDDCGCRKPRPGMLLRAARRMGLDPAASFMVGDRWRDIEAGRAAGCRTILIDHGYADNDIARPDFRVRSMGEAAQGILRLAGQLGGRR